MEEELIVSEMERSIELEEEIRKLKDKWPQNV